MRVVVLCILGSMSLAPLRCGSSGNDCGSPSSKQPAAQTETTTDTPRPTSNGRTDTQASLKHDDALVPPLDLGTVPEETDIGPLSGADFTGFDFTSDSRAQFHAHGAQVCASGCAASRHPTNELTKSKYLWLLKQFAEEPMSEDSPALESLLFYGRQTLVWMNRLGTEPLDKKRTAFLKRQLTRTHALISFRIVDEHGETRVFMPPTRVPLDRRHEFRMETKDLPPLITSGTVKRVGLHHLWTRL